MKSYMKIAIGEAKKALFKDEVPIGAVIVDKRGFIIAKSGNKNRELNDQKSVPEVMFLRKNVTRATLAKEGRLLVDIKR